MDYKEKLELAKDWYNDQSTTKKEKVLLENLFPELAGSEWKIRSCIGMCLTDANEQRFKDYNTSLKDCLAWLEKQSEQKYIWSEEDKKQLERAIYMMEQLNMTKSWDDVYNWLKSIKPQPHWKPTEEQMEDLKYAINMVDKCCEDSLQSLYNELKKL